jgi:hypothetical protein
MESAFAALMTDQWREKQMAATVLDYVRSNPSAVDTVWSIRQSWLDDPDMDLSLVERALQRLADDGFMARPPPSINAYVVGSGMAGANASYGTLPMLKSQVEASIRS